MGLLDFEIALGRLVRAPDGGDPFRLLRLEVGERLYLEALLPQSAGFLFTVAVQRSWCVNRAVRAGSITLSVLPDNLRRRLLDEWTSSGGGTSSFFAAEAEALLDFIADRLPDPSHELAACRFEQLTRRANDKASCFTAPDLVRLDVPQCVLSRGRYAGIVPFHGEPHMILSALMRREAVPAISPDVTTVLLAPGLDQLWRPAAANEVELWMRLAVPSALTELLRGGYPREAIEAMLSAGALEYDE